MNPAEKFHAETTPFRWGHGRCWRAPHWPEGHFVVIELSMRAGVVHFGSVLTPSDIRGRGYASEAIKHIFELSRGFSIVGEISPFGAPGSKLNRRQLRAWYKRLGFEVRQNGMIVKLASK